MAELTYPDIYFTEPYQTLFKDTAFGGEPHQFTCAGIDYRFYKRPILNTEYFDIVSPYGYSGPIAVQSNPDWSAFSKSFEVYCYHHNIIAEFARLHPFEEQYLNRRYEHDVFYVDLCQSQEQIWHNFDKGCKSAIKKAECNLKYIVKGSYWEHAPEFDTIYAQAMADKNAADYCFLNLLPNSKIQPYLISAWQDSMMVSGALFLSYGRYWHYWLSATRHGFYHLNANNLILAEAIQLAKQVGCEIFNLGGGLKAGDSLESFKSSFTKTSLPFYTYRKVHNSHIYEQLCRDKGVEPTVNEYFPAYRR